MDKETVETSEIIEEYSRHVNRNVLLLLWSTGAFVLLIIIYALYLNSTAQLFPVNETVTIEDGLSVAEISELLKQKNIVRSSLLLQITMRYKYKGTFIQAGDYLFESKLTTGEVSKVLAEGATAESHVVLTIPEGLDGEGISAILGTKFPNLKDVVTTEMLDEHIGYLFPDTYFVDPEITSDELIQLFRDTFDEKTKQYESDFSDSILTKDGIIILASIVEREANTEESMRTVAGILWSRIAIGMPLQVDATFEFLLGKTSAELTIEDLKIDSPYNTYTNRGLPPTPIANPGLLAIDAVLNPIDSPYLYYLTAPDGTFYYAETFEGHKRNKERYLR